MINLQAIRCIKFIYRGKSYENVVVIFIYEGMEKMQKIRLKSVANLIPIREENFERIFVYPCFSKKWVINEDVINASIRIAEQLKKLYANVSIIYPTYTRNFTLIPSSQRYLLFKATLIF